MLIAMFTIFVFGGAITHVAISLDVRAPPATEPAPTRYRNPSTSREAPIEPNRSFEPAHPCTNAPHPHMLAAHCPPESLGVGEPAAAAVPFFRAQVLEAKEDMAAGDNDHIEKINSRMSMMAADRTSVSGKAWRNLLETITHDSMDDTGTVRANRTTPCLIQTRTRTQPTWRDGMATVRARVSRVTGNTNPRPGVDGTCARARDAMAGFKHGTEVTQQITQRRARGRQPAGAGRRAGVCRSVQQLTACTVHVLMVA